MFAIKKKQKHKPLGAIVFFIKYCHTALHMCSIMQLTVMQHGMLSTKTTDYS